MFCMFKMYLTPCFLNLSVICLGIYLDILTLSRSVVIPPVSPFLKQLKTIMLGKVL